MAGLHYESQCGCGSSQHTLTNREACYQRLAKTYTSYTDWYTDPPETTVDVEQPHM